MPCIFCVAVFAMLAGAVTTAVLDQMESRLATIATGPLTRPVNSASVARVDTTVAVPGTGSAGRSIPVAVTVYKRHKRVRIQVMTHDVTRAEAELVENLVAETLGLRIVDRSDAHDERKVREAFADTAETAETADDERDTVAVQTTGRTDDPRRPN
ncbi:MAG TPA: hypothetical protein VFX70_17610 [Mycobacteriales bacterium]|nr:hypothetical protein [Mycobacteriales bacterium]